MRNDTWPVRNRGGILIRLLLFLLVLAALCSLAWMLFLPLVVTQAISSRTGFEVKVESLSANPFAAKLHVKGLKIRNPDSFPVKDFVDIREISADAELTSLFGDKIVFDEIAVDVAQLALVKNKAGTNNATVFKERLLGASPSASSSPLLDAKTKASGSKKEFLIRKLELRFDKLLLVDGTNQRPDTKEINLNFSHNYANVTSPVQIAVPIVGKVNLQGLSLGDFAGKLGPQALEEARKTGAQLKELGRKTGETLKDIFKSLKEKVGK